MSWIKKAETGDHTHTNKVVLDKIGESGGSLTFNGSAITGGGTPPANKAVLDSLGESGGDLTFNGVVINDVADTYNTTVYQSDLTAAQFNWYNAKDNGLVGDGVTSDSVSMQNLVNSISALGGGTIYAPKATYLITTSVIWKSNVSLVGDGKGLTTFKGKATIPTPVFKQLTEQTKNVHFRDFTVDGYEVITAAYDVANKAFFFQEVISSSWRDIELKGTGATSLGVDFLHDVHIDNVTVIEGGRQWVEGNPGGAGIGIGTGFLALENLTITNCKTYNCGSYGIFLEDQGHFSQGTEDAKGVVISNCIATKGRGSGISVKAGMNVSVSDCHTYENARYGLYLCWELDKVKVSNNTVSENTLGGIFIDNGAVLNNLVINDNIITDNSADGIKFGTSIVYGNTIVIDNLISGNSGTDIFVASNPDPMTIRLRNNDSIGNVKNSGKLHLAWPKSYAKFPPQLLENENNEIILKFKFSSSGCLLSKKDVNFSTSSLVKGFSVRLVSGKVRIEGYKVNDGTKFMYEYSEVIATGVKHFLKIGYLSTAPTVSLSADGMTFTPLTKDTSTSIGTDADIISILGLLSNTETNIGREWGGSSGWINPCSGLVLYKMNINSAASSSYAKYEYRFNNIGANTEIYELNGTRLNGRAGLGANQMANEVD